MEFKDFNVTEFKGAVKEAAGKVGVAVGDTVERLMRKNILTAPFMIEMIRTATNMYDHGWDERNGGNISLMVDEEEVAKYLDLTAVLREIPTGFDAPTLDGKYFPSRVGASKPVGISRRTAVRSKYLATSSSSTIRLMLPPLRSSQPWSYILVAVRIISIMKGAVRIFFRMRRSTVSPTATPTLPAASLTAPLNSVTLKSLNSMLILLIFSWKARRLHIF